MKREKPFYFTTRDLMMMAALAALGGVAGTYINFIGDFFQSLLGFAGTTQWAAGLHIIWIMLAAALVGKPGAATATGILKGFTEFLSGNTHGLLVLIVDILAGLIVDLVLLPRRDKQPGLLFYLAAGLSSASNIFVFQFFASIPEDILTFFSILLTSSVAFTSGIVFGGLLVRSLLATLKKIGILAAGDERRLAEKPIWPAAILITAVILSVGAGYLHFRQQASEQGIAIGGKVANPYQFPNVNYPLDEVKIQAELNNVSSSYTGVHLSELIDIARPLDRSGLLQITASDGYSFFISLDEVYTNRNLILSDQMAGNKTSYSIVGAISSKAWVRGVSGISVVDSGQIKIGGNVANPFTFKPSEWVGDMDSTFLNLDGEQVKLQGVGIQSIWEKAQPNESADEISLISFTETHYLNKSEFLENNEFRFFTLLGGNGMEFLLGKMNGEVIFRNIQSVEIR